MASQLGGSGWQRVLDRLKQLCGASGRAGLPAAPAAATDVLEANAPLASADTPA